MKRYPNLSPYNAFENNPIYFKDPGGLDAEYSIIGNTITFSAKVVVVGDGATSERCKEIQIQIMNKFNKVGTYKDDKGQVYNIKFNIKVVTAENVGNLTPSTNVVKLISNVDPKMRSWVKGWYGLWNENDKDAYPHEMGHFIGLDDRYIEFMHLASNLPSDDKDFRYFSNSGNTDVNEVMGVNSRSGKAKISQQDINALAEYALKNQKNGKGIIKTGVVNTPTNEDILSSKKEASDDKVVKPDRNSLIH